MTVKTINMDDDKKIFVDWLKKVIKIDGRIKGKALAIKIGVDPSTISGYLTGRTKGPELPLREKICEVLNQNYDELIENLKSSKQSPPPIQESEFDSVKKEVSDLKAQFSELKMSTTTSNKDPIKLKHHSIIDQFPDPEKALLMNERAVQLARLDPRAIDDIIDYIELKLNKRHRRPPEDPEKKTANGMGS